MKQEHKLDVFECRPEKQQAFARLEKLDAV